MRWVRILIKLGLAFLALLAGCKGPSGGYTLYGVPPAEKNPDVVIEDFSYSPSQDLRVGDTVTFTVRLSDHLEYDEGDVTVAFNREFNIPAASQSIHLNDGGYAPDEVAEDGVYTGSIELRTDCLTAPVVARYFDLERYAAPLTVLPAEDE